MVPSASIVAMSPGSDHRSPSISTKVRCAALRILVVTDYISLVTTKTRSAARWTFVLIDGERWSLPGDMATIDADGTIHLLGRGAMCINTGGEKVYPEEVEAVLKNHAEIEDAVVLGVPDERFGQRVARGRGGRERRGRAGSRRTANALPGTPRRLQSAARRSRRGTIPRMPAGKADYAWACEPSTPSSSGAPALPRSLWFTIDRTNPTSTV